ncbi:MAG TPA: hypothetical protein VFW88_09555, partial [Burkholderiales bacterium]|nr:hypothetical protein [Burkholderiales bacterium]
MQLPAYARLPRPADNRVIGCGMAVLLGIALGICTGQAAAAPAVRLAVNSMALAETTPSVPAAPPTQSAQSPSSAQSTQAPAQSPQSPSVQSPAPAQSSPPPAAADSDTSSPAATPPTPSAPPASAPTAPAAGVPGSAAPPKSPPAASAPAAPPKAPSPSAAAPSAPPAGPAQGEPAPATSAGAAGEKSLTGATFNFAPNDPPGEWHSQARDYANTRYSPLNKINTKNVDQLQIAWTFSDGTKNGHEAAPLVVGDTMYVVTPFPDILFALDLSKPGAPIKWTFK